MKSKPKRTKRTTFKQDLEIAIEELASAERAAERYREDPIMGPYALRRLDSAQRAHAMAERMLHWTPAKVDALYLRQIEAWERYCGIRT